MRTDNLHDLTQAQDPGSYAQLIQLRISLASKPRAPGKRDTFIYLRGLQGQLCYARLCFLSVISVSYEKIQFHIATSAGV